MMRWYRCYVCSSLSAFHAKTSWLCVGLANTLSMLVWKCTALENITFAHPFLYKFLHFNCSFVIQCGAVLHRNTLKCNWKLICICDTCNTQNSCKNLFKKTMVNIAGCILYCVSKAVHGKAHNASKANAFYTLQSTYIHKMYKHI